MKVIEEGIILDALIAQSHAEKDAGSGRSGEAALLEAHECVSSISM